MRAYFVTLTKKQNTTFNTFHTVYPDNRPILVISNDLTDVVKVYPTAFEIKEADVKSVEIVKGIVVKE